MAFRTHRLALAVLGAFTVVAALAGCVDGGEKMPVPTNSSSASSTPTPKPTLTPEIHPGGSAAVNQPFFDYLGNKYFAERGIGTGEEIINNLVASGFVKADMQLTPDTTALGIAADSIIFSVKINDECLIGQNSAAGFKSVIAPVLGTGLCLIGVTRTIDW